MSDNFSKKSLNILSETVYYQKYAKYLPDLKRREIWSETVERNKQMHLKKYGHIENVIPYINKAFEMVSEKKILPSMRSMQFGGIAIERKNERLYNCCGLGIGSIKDFSDLFYLLLCGCGVGVNIKKVWIEKLPNLIPITKESEDVIVIDDSIEGWADAAYKLIDSYVTTGGKIKFDYSQIRPSGSLVSSTGCIAPGPESLQKALEDIDSLLWDRVMVKKQNKLKSIDIFDICCHLAYCVVSGGHRRSALITLIDKDDEEMLNSKKGIWWEKNIQRSMSNNSVGLLYDTTTEEDFDKVFSACEESKCGEPGISWTNNEEWCWNPCHEVSFPSRNFCNLTEINLGSVKDQKDFEERCFYAAVLGTLQAGFTDFSYIHQDWKINADKAALLGVSCTGIGSCKKNLFFNDGAAKVKEANSIIAKIIGINTAERTTVIKPSGTASTVLGTSSGIHPWYSEYYKRRVRVNKHEPLYSYIKEKFPEMIEDSLQNSNDAVMTYYIKAPDDAITRDTMSVITFLELVKKINEEWVRGGHRTGKNYNNVSCTVSVKNDEWEKVKAWMWKNRWDYHGISLLPYSDANYEQAPFEEITKEEFEENFKDVSLELSNIIEEQNFVNFGESLACSGGGCEIL